MGRRTGLPGVFPHRRRTERVRERLRDRGAGALVLPPGTNLRYLAGYAGEQSERHFLLFVPATGEPTLFVPELEAADARAATWVPDVRTWRDDGDPRVALGELVEDLDLDGERVLLGDRLWATFVRDLRNALPEATFGLASEVLAPLRRRKDDAELDALRQAAGMADAVVGTLRAMGDEAVGRTERELAREVADLLVGEGGDSEAFGTVVAAGPNGARPHHAPGDREIRPGDPVVLDFGTTVEGYPSDVTRTLVFGGEPTDRFREVHRVVREAQAAGVDAVEPGRPAAAVDAAVRGVVEAAGYGDAFVHRTGHGVGLDVHEEPYVAGNSEATLEPGMVFSVEPGVYLDGEFGVRVEDLVVVTDDGCERLNRADRGWDAR
jgi:Xaa-Pro aminopeptidase